MLFVRVLGNGTSTSTGLSIIFRDNLTTIDLVLDTLPHTLHTKILTSTFVKKTMTNHHDNL